MTTYTKETALYDTGAIAGDIQEAGAKATSYITQISQNQGIWITPSDHKPDPSTGEPVTTGNNKTRGWRIKDALEMFWEGISYIWAGITNNIATVRVGKETGGHSVIDENGMRVYGSSGGNVPLANIGYGEGQSQSGTAVAPYYTFGVREANSTIGNYSIAEGHNTRATAYASHAEGDSTRADGTNSHAEGFASFATGPWSHAEGVYCVASGESSHAQNWQCKARSNAQTAIGRFNSEDSDGVYAFIIGNGTSSGRSNGLTVDWSGNVDIASGASYSVGGVPIFQSGHVVFSSIATNSYADKTVTFSTSFNSAPNVVATLSTSGTAGNIGNVSVSVFNITSTDCTIRVFNNRGSSLSPAVEWVAVGMS